MEDLCCPRCRMTKYRNPSLQLMINSCGHPLCKSCVDLVFVRESAPCPECGITIRRGGFRTQVFEDTVVDKEVDIRKYVLKIYNKLETDFSSLREYNDYLEDVEDIIWSLESGKNEKETREKIAQYRLENEAAIRKNQVRINQERAYFKEALAREARDKEARAQLRSRLDQEADEARRRVEEDFLEDLKSNSKLTSEELLARRRQLDVDDKMKNLKEDRMSLDVYVNVSKSEPPGPVEDNDAMDDIYTYECVEMDIAGPALPNQSDLHKCGYMRHVREATPRDVGGGYTTTLACERALCDAFGGLFATPDSTASKVM